MEEEGETPLYVGTLSPTLERSPEKAQKGPNMDGQCEETRHEGTGNTQAALDGEHLAWPSDGLIGLEKGLKGAVLSRTTGTFACL